MADEKRAEPAQGQIHQTDFGTIRVDDEVVASVAAIAAGSVEGIAHASSNEGLIGTMTDSFSGMLGKKAGSKGVRVDFKEDGFNILLNVKVLYGYGIPDLAHEVQRKVKDDVEKMTGMKVRAVDLFVQGIVFDTINDNAMGD